MIGEYLKIVIPQKAKPFQREFFRDALENRYCAVLGSRQIGKSWVLGLIALTLASGANGSPAHDVLMVSKSQETAKELIKSVTKHVIAAEKVTGRVLRHSRLGGVQEVVLSNGYRVKALPGTARTLQGFTGSVIVDEVSANTSPPEELFAQALSCSSSRDYMKVILASNADVEGSWVHNFWHSSDPEWALRRDGWKLRNYTIHDVYTDGLPNRLVKIRATIGRRQWARFYQNQFLGSGLGILEASQFAYGDPPPSGRVYIGIDPGFSATGNPTGVVVVRVGEGRIGILESEWWQGVPLAEQEARIKALRLRYPQSKIYIDQGAQGWVLAQAIKPLGAVELVSVTQNGMETAWHTLVANLPDIVWDRPQSPVVEDALSAVWDDRGRLLIPERSYPDGRPGKIHGDALMALLYIIGEAAKHKGGSPRGVSYTARRAGLPGMG